MDHDRLFKELLRTFFAEFLDLFLPAVSAYVEPGSIEFLDKELFTDLTAGDRHEVDLLAKCRFRGKEARFLVHVETQASKQSDFAGRMFRYFARLSEQHALPVYPIALFTFDAPRKPEPELYEVKFPNLDVLAFRFRAIQLNQLDWRDFVKRENPVAAALMAKMRIAPGDRPRVKVQCVRLIATLKLNRAKHALIRDFMDAYLRLSAAENATYNAEVQRLDPSEQEAVMKIVNQWEEIGEARGDARGSARTATNMVMRLLRRRLGEVPEDLRQQIESLPVATLEDLNEAALDFRSVADAEQWVAARST